MNTKKMLGMLISAVMLLAIAVVLGRDFGTMGTVNLDFFAGHLLVYSAALFLVLFFLEAFKTSVYKR